MAYIVNPDVNGKDPNDVAQLTGPKLLTGAPGGDGNANPLVGNAATNAAYSPASNSPTSSGSFTNLQQYLDTNQPQATQLGQKLGSDLTQKATDATGAIDSAATNFRQQVDQNTVRLDPTLQDRAVNDSANFVNSADFDKYSKILAGTYAGPKSLDAVQDLYKPVVDKVTAADTAAQLGQTSGGRMELLRQLPGSTPYARGGLSLDQMLVQNTDPARQAVEQGIEAIKPVDNKLTQTQAELQQNAIDATGRSAEAGVQAKNGLLNAQASLRDQLNQRVTQEQSALAAEQEAVKNALAEASATGGSPNPVGGLGLVLKALSGLPQVPSAFAGLMDQTGTALSPTQRQVQQMTPEQLAALGLSDAQLQNLQGLQAQARELGGAGVNFADYLHTVNPNQVGLGQVATEADIAKYNALQKMAGTTDTFLPSTVGAPISPFNFDGTSAMALLQSQIDAGKARQQAEAQAKAAAEQNAAAMAQAQNNANKAAKAADKQSTLSGAAAGASIGAAVSDGIGAVVGGVLGAVFCFVKGTPMLMADGSAKKVEEIEIGDEMALGGRVFATGKAVEQSIYKYHGTYMGGNHTVFCEDGVWRKVADAVGAEQVELDGGVIVCPIVNEHHLMVTGDFISADFAEVDNIGWDMNGKDRLDYLNNWTERNEKLLNVLKSVFPDKYMDEDKTISAE